MVSFVTITVYLASYIACVGRLPISISDTYYKLEKKWLFPTFLGVAILTGLAPMFELTSESYQFLAFLTLAGLMFVAAAPAFKEDLESKVHCAGALVAGASCLTWLILQGGTPLIAIAVTSVALLDRKRWCFYLELGLLLNMYLMLIYLAMLKYIDCV